MRRPRVWSRRSGTRAASGLPPGATRARQELTEGSVCAVERKDRTKAGPGVEQTLQLARREAPACRKARHLRFAFFGAPSPHRFAGNARRESLRASPRREPSQSGRAQCLLSWIPACAGKTNVMLCRKRMRR